MIEILSAQNPLVKYWTELKDSSHFRKAQSRVLLEGKNCIQDVCKKLKAKRLIVSDKTLITSSLLADEIIVVTDAIMKKISGTKSPEGMIAELDMPKSGPLLNPKKILVADHIQDPGNLGTLIRSALAFGWDGFFLLPGTSDPFNDKALRASKGAAFHLPLYYGNWQDLQEILKKHSLQLIVADISGDEPSNFTGMPMALLLGNEAQGAQIPEGQACRKVSLCMPGSDSMESLNVAVAGSILLYLYQEGT